jgi:hypothetical protein
MDVIELAGLEESIEKNLLVVFISLGLLFYCPYKVRPLLAPNFLEELLEKLDALVNVHF